MIRAGDRGIGALTVGCKYTVGVPLSKVIKAWLLQWASDQKGQPKFDCHPLPCHPDITEYTCFVVFPSTEPF